MCRKSPEPCQAKTKCKCCVKMVDSEQETGKLNLNEVDNNFEQQQHYIIEIKGE